MADSTTYEAHLLSNGRYAVLLSAGCGGCSVLDGLAVTRWAPDPTLDRDGFIIYIRDLDTGAFWRAAGPPGDGFSFTYDGVRGRFRGAAAGIESDFCIIAAADKDAELRSLTLRNRGSSSRRLEVTTYVELALNTLAGDAAHPAFSKLFVQTAHEQAQGALLAERRLRSPDERRLCAGHVLLGGDDRLEFETDRARFIGRGNDSRMPAALACRAPLSGTVGAVLDPVFSLRRGVTLEPGATTRLTAVLAAAVDCAGVLDTLRDLSRGGAVRDAFAAASAAPAAAHASAYITLGMPTRWSEDVCLGGAVSRAATRSEIHIRTVSAATALDSHAAEPHETLQFFNGWGGFSADGAEYVLLLPRNGAGVRRPPLPWVNVIANEDAGCMVSESGATYTWAGNSRENRLTPWPNDPVTDPHGEALYVRDEATGAFWSPTPGPCPGAGDYEVRHGFGSTTFRHVSGGLEQEVVIFVPADAPVRVARVRVTNRDAVPRRLTVASYAQLVLGTHEADTRGRVETAFDGELSAILAVQRERGEFSDRVAVAASAGAGSLSWTSDRREFLGSGGSVGAPVALCAGVLAGRAGAGLDPCAVLARTFDAGPGDTHECVFVLGEAADAAGARAIAERFADVARAEADLQAVRAAWRERLDTVRVRTPSPAIDLMVNGWLAYQNLSCRMWGRSAYYQSGGAFGFRDQLQDASALLYMDPAITRRQILLHAAHQFIEGDVLHWWHPPLGKGIRTRFSDDLLWLPYITAFYVARTGDAGILDEDVRFLRAQLLQDGQDEVFVVPADSGTSGSLYEHCCRALDRSLTRGAHGLPLMGVGDWNDGMNRVGREGRGESVWLGFFLFDILRDFIPICDARGDATRRDRYAAYRERLYAALNDTGWDGNWYRRAYYDSGEPIGSAGSDECRIDALAQAWAVLSGAAPADRAVRALDAMEKHLVSEEDGIIRLLEPAFDRTPNDPGYIKGYLPGVRENGGQYTHGVLWAVRALAEHGRSDRAAALLEMLTPVVHGSTPERASRYRVEPYVVAADVYGVAPHVGRGGWTWYTGSAGWMLRVALESVLGVGIRGGTELALRPCIPADWPGFNVRLRLDDGTRYDLEVERTTGASSIAEGDGAAVTAAPAADGALRIRLVRDGGEHCVRVLLGPDVGPRYVSR
jgi:N,N'-diacetylchitobiose phosphorylase